MDYAKLLEKRDDTHPLYVQLKEALTGAIGSGDLPTGTRLEVSHGAGDERLLGNLCRRSEVGILAIEFSTRRRMRLNGRAELRGREVIHVRPEQVYSNCPSSFMSARSSRPTSARPWSLRPAASLDGGMSIGT